jgi:hypothetical protein
MVIDGPCSALRGEVGPAAWVVLEDLLTGATVDGETRWAVSRTTVLVDAVPSDLPSAPVARSVKAAVSSPGGRAGSERGGAAVDVWVRDSGGSAVRVGCHRLLTVLRLHLHASRDVRRSVERGHCPLVPTASQLAIRHR